MKGEERIMSEKKNDLVFWAVVLGLLSLSFLLKLAGPWMVEFLYQSDNLAFLNAIASSQEVLPLAFYTGQLDDRFFGPLSILFSGIAFLSLGLKFLPSLAGARIFVYFLAYFFITKWDTFLFPPYGDSASGPMMEAVWLLQNNFDFVKLSQQPLFIVGGPKAYLFSLYPVFQALLMKLTPTPQVFLAVNHSITYIFSAIVMALFFMILSRVWNTQRAFLLSFLFLVLPLTQSQVEQLNMEIPTLLFIMAGFYYLSKKDIFKAALFSGLAIFVKIYALFAAATICVAGLFLFFFDDEKRGKISILFSAILAIIFAFLGAWLLCFVINPAGKVDKVGPLQGWPLMRQFPITYFFLISFLAYIIIAYRDIAKRSIGYGRGVVLFIKENFMVTAMFTASAAWFVLFANSFWIPPRYTLILFPSLIVAIAGTAVFFIQREKILQRILIALIIFALLSSHGAVYKPLAIEDYSVTERSLEYRNDIKLHMRIGQRLSESYSDLTIAAPFNFAQMLAFPEIGFASKKLDVMIYLFPCLYGNVKNFDGIENLDITKVLWLGVHTPFMRPPYFPFGPGDFVVEKIYMGNKSAVLFFGGYSIDAIYHQGQAFMKFLESSGYLGKDSKVYH